MAKWMRTAVGAFCAIVIAVGVGVGTGAQADEPVFVRWLVMDDPGDETIMDYWERAERGELDAPSLVDLGTMLFFRGYPDDAIDSYRSALKIDPGLFEAWFRIGLVEHSRGELDNAEQAYRRCLKKVPGHAWCNFYYGLLEEQLGHTKRALKLYEKAFHVAPQLADRDFNPELMSSRLVLAAQLRHYDQKRFEHVLPMRYLRPNKVNKVRQSYTTTPVPTEVPEAVADTAPETATSPAAPAARPTPAAPTSAPSPAPPARRVPTRPPAQPGSPPGSTGGETPYGTPMTPIANASDEAHLVPGWSALRRLTEALV